MYEFAFFLLNLFLIQPNGDPIDDKIYYALLVVYMGMLQIHCTMGYHLMALLHTELLLEFHIVSHATATPLNHLSSLFAEHIDISDGSGVQVAYKSQTLQRMWLVLLLFTYLSAMG